MPTQAVPLWTVGRKVGPTTYPVSIQEAKRKLRLLESDPHFDSELERQIYAATEQLEQDCDQAVMTQTLVYETTGFPSYSRPIMLPRRPVQSITQIDYVDPDGNPATWDSAEYKLNKSARLVIPEDTYPDADSNVLYGVQVTYVAGYGDDGAFVPAYHKEAILLQVGKWHRDPMMEDHESYAHDRAYRNLVDKILRTSYP